MSAAIVRIGLLLVLGWVLTAPPSPAAALEIVAGERGGLTLDVNAGRLIRLASPAATVFVANPEIADIQVKSPRLVYLFAKQPGETTLFAVDGAEKVLASLEVHVTHNLSRLRSSISKLHPAGGIEVSSVEDRVLIEGLVAHPGEAEAIRRLAIAAAGDEEKVINRLGITAPMQVNLRVRIAEVARDIDKQLGINWDILANVGAFSFGIVTANPFSLNATTQSVVAGYSGGSFNLDALVDALDQEGLVTVLAEPNLTAVSGETASFLAGGEFPILVPDSDGRVTIEFKKFGVSLAFTPTLVGDNRINLHVRPEVSELSNTASVTLAGFEIPSLTTRRAETTVELGSGQSFAIAGLIRNGVTHSVSKFPGLGDVPVLGGLFRSDRFQREESELVIIVTPYVVRPQSHARLSSPTDGLRSPNDWQRFETGGTNRQTETAGTPATVDERGRRLIGPAGFDLGN